MTEDTSRDGVQGWQISPTVSGLTPEPTTRLLKPETGFWAVKPELIWQNCFHHMFEILPNTDKYSPELCLSGSAQSEVSCSAHSLVPEGENIEFVEPPQFLIQLLDSRKHYLCHMTSSSRLYKLMESLLMLLHVN